MKTTVFMGLIVLLSGCVSNSEQPSLAGKIGGTASAVGGGIKNVASGLFGGYENGTNVPEAKLAELKLGESTERDVERVIGLAPEKQQMDDGEVWRYPYTKITHFSGNTNNTTVIEFNRNGVVTKAYKVDTRSSSTGNPLVDAANGVE